MNLFAIATTCSCSMLLSFRSSLSTDVNALSSRRACSSRSTYLSISFSSTGTSSFCRSRLDAEATSVETKASIGRSPLSLNRPTRSSKSFTAPAFAIADTIADKVRRALAASRSGGPEALNSVIFLCRASLTKSDTLLVAYASNTGHSLPSAVLHVGTSDAARKTSPSSPTFIVAVDFRPPCRAYQIGHELPLRPRSAGERHMQYLSPRVGPMQPCVGQSSSSQDRACFEGPC